MRNLLIVAWLFVPLVGAAYHYGPGQEKLELDRAADSIETGEAAAKAEDWGAAISAYQDALAALPDDHQTERRRVRLEKAKAQMQASQLPDARADLQGLMEELQDDPKADPKVAAETRLALANSQYYMTWLMRLEGLPRTEWEPEIEAARQNYRLLATDAKKPTARVNRQEDLASAVRLARLDLDELQGLPIPNQ